LIEKSLESIWHHSLILTLHPKTAKYRILQNDCSELLTKPPSTTLAFTTDPDFTVTAAPIEWDAAVIELGVGASLGPSSCLNVVHTTTLSGQSSNQMLQVQMQCLFQWERLLSLRY